jgi:hypothetical protein
MEFSGGSNRNFPQGNGKENKEIDECLCARSLSGHEVARKRRRPMDTKKTTELLQLDLLSSHIL